MQTEVEPIPLADIGLAGKEVDIDNSSYPLGNYEGSAGYYAPSAQEQPEALLCHPAVRGEPNVPGQLGLNIVVQADHQALQTRPMRLLTPGAESAERFAVLTESIGSAAEAAALVVFAELVARPVAGLVLQPAELEVSVESAAAELDQPHVEAAKTWQQLDLGLVDSQPAHYAVDALSLTTEGSSAGLAP
uniref:Uncharacterized protein n=1 Tax=Oryza sativa subsp. japonica TaxID=39947 RepID=Q6K3Y8_ORYSJ|nr:hypothetical protein [Oryza sativa Japonica Group]